MIGHPETLVTPKSPTGREAGFKELYSETDEPRNRLIDVFRVLIRLIQNITGLVIKPDQTLREYINKTGKQTGSASTHIAKFTRVIEKILYSEE